MFIHLNLSLLNPSETETLSEHHFLHDVLLARCFWVFGVLGLCFISWPLWLVSGFVEFCSWERGDLLEKIDVLKHHVRKRTSLAHLEGS